MTNQFRADLWAHGTLVNMLVLHFCLPSSVGEINANAVAAALDKMLGRYPDGALVEPLTIDQKQAIVDDVLRAFSS